MTLLEECLIELRNFEICSESESIALFDKLVEAFPFTSWGRVDWDNVTISSKIRNVVDAFRLCMKQECLIFWDMDSLPVIKTSFEDVARCVESVTAVSFDTWLLNSSFDCLIEFYHEGEVMMGYNKGRQAITLSSRSKS